MTTPNNNTPQNLLAPDETFRGLITNNVNAAWKMYCEKNGLDPNAVDNEEIIIPEDCPF